jgi:hypothetical protein
MPWLWDRGRLHAVALIIFCLKCCKALSMGFMALQEWRVAPAVADTPCAVCGLAGRLQSSRKRSPCKCAAEVPCLLKMSVTGFCLAGVLW